MCQPTASVCREPETIVELLNDDGSIPNNPQLPLIAYLGALHLTVENPASICEEIFAAHGWGGSWRNGVYSFHHYHSTAHEVLAIVHGRASVALGGEKGITLDVTAGDVIILPAGVGHKNLGSSHDLLVIGAYPPGQHWDLCRGLANERPDALVRIAAVPLPATDPVYGVGGPLRNHWYG